MLFFIFKSTVIANLLPMGGFHQTNDWVNVGNVYKIPPNAVIIPLIGDIMHDSEYFENPYKFEPNRYLSKLSDNDIKFTPNPRVVPFGIGKRKCLGEVIARTSLYKFFTAILQKYKIVSGQDDPILEKRKIGFVSVPEKYHIKFVRL